MFRGPWLFPCKCWGHKKIRTKLFPKIKEVPWPIKQKPEQATWTNKETLELEPGWWEGRWQSQSAKSLDVQGHYCSSARMLFEVITEPIHNAQILDGQLLQCRADKKRNPPTGGGDHKLSWLVCALEWKSKKEARLKVLWTHLAIVAGYESTRTFVMWKLEA